MLTLLFARAGEDIRGELLERMAKSQAKKRLLLVPEQYSHDTERELCRALGNAGARDCEVLSFTRLWARVSDVAGGGAAPTLDAGGRMLLLYRALRQVGDLLTGYGAASRRPAFLSGLLASIDECRSYGVAPEQLIKAGEALSGPQGDRLRDIGVIFGAYEALSRQGRADPRARLDRLAAALEDTGWAAGREFWVWGFTDLTPQEGGVIRALLKRAPVTAALTCDMDDPSDIFDPARRTASYLARLAREAGAPVQREKVQRPAPREGSLRHLERQLFAQVPQPWRGDCAVTRVTACDPRRELEWTCAEILRLVREEGYRFREIGVCARDFSAYDGLAESVFGQYGIPLFRAVMDDVLQKPVLALVTAALSAVADNYPYDELFRCLKTGLAGISDEERDLLENYVVTWDIKGSMWTRKKPWDMHPEGYGQTFTPADEELLERLDNIRRRVIAPLEAVRRAGDKTGKGRAMALWRLLEEIGLPERLEERAGLLEERGDLTAAAEYRQLWEILTGALEQCALLLGDMDLEPDEFSRLLSLALSQYSVGAIPVSLDRVQAGDAPRLAGRNIRALFFLGADSSSVPYCAPAPGLFTDLDREALAALDVVLAPRQGDKLQRELTILYEACSLPREKLYVSYAAAGPFGGARAPSFLLDRLAVLFPDGRAVAAGEDCRLAAPGPALELAQRLPAAAKALSALPGWREKAERVEGAARWRRGSLSSAGVDALYGGTVPMSATRLDLLNSCHFSHFMRFGLEAKPRRRASFRPSDYGTFIHAVLEEVLQRALGIPGGVKALAEDREKCRALALEAADRYEREALSGLDDETARFRYTFRRMKESALVVAESVCGELAVSDFTPAFFELGFGRGADKPLPPIEVEKGITLRLSGFVDRVDSWVKDGKRYIRVVDYKTGKKSFDFADVADGRGLQMLLYLFALRREGGSLFGPEELIPAGVLYVPARSPVVNGSRSMTEEELTEARQKELRRKGLVLADQEVLDAMEHSGGPFRYLPIGEQNKQEYLVTPEELEKLDGVLTRALERAAEQLSRGNIDADPFWHNDQKNACAWCDYAEACHFEESRGDRVRRRRALSAAEFWDMVKKEGEEHGDRAD